MLVISPIEIESEANSENESIPVVKLNTADNIFELLKKKLSFLKKEKYITEQEDIDYMQIGESIQVRGIVSDFIVAEYDLGEDEELIPKTGIICVRISKGQNVFLHVDLRENEGKQEMNIGKYITLKGEVGEFHMNSINPTALEGKEDVIDYLQEKQEIEQNGFVKLLEIQVELDNYVEQIDNGEGNGEELKEKCFELEKEKKKYELPKSIIFKSFQS